MRTKVTLVLIFLNLALFFFIFKFERQWRTEARSLEERRRVLGAEVADIRTLDVTLPAGSYSLTRNRDTWLITRPLDWPANPHAVSSIIHELKLLDHVTRFSTKDLGKNNNPTLADYGLDKPKITVAFTSGDPAAASGPQPPTILRIGDTTKTGDRLYILSPDGEWVHVVERAKVDSLFLTLDQLRADTLLTIPVFEARSLSLQTANTDQAPTGVRVRVRRDGTRWMFDTPITARASKTAVEVAINQLNALHPKTFNPPPLATSPQAAPVLKIALEGNGRLETLFIGERVPVAAPAAGAKPAAPADPEYYAQLEGRSALFTVVVPAGLIDQLRNATEKLREARLLDFDANVVTAITIAAPIQSNQAPLTLQRLETASAAEGGAWQIVRRGDGNQGLAPADRAAVKRLLDQLTSLSAKPAGGFVSDNPSSAQLEDWGFNRPEREITLTLATPGPAAPAGAAAAPATASATVVLRLGTDASRNVFARVGNATEPGASIYAVTVDLPNEFPAEPLAWRDRAVSIIPPNARITALKLTELPARREIFETAFDAAGVPARSPDAVQKLVKELHPTLRAKRFRPEPFGTEERPWKYQLDVTISLPGGAGGDQPETKTLFFSDRLGGNEQLGGAKDDAVFELGQPLIDALFPLTAGQRDPGPAPETPPAKAPATK